MQIFGGNKYLKFGQSIGSHIIHILVLYWVQATVNELRIYTVAQLVAAEAVFSAQRAVLRSDSQLFDIGA